MTDMKQCKHEGCDRTFIDGAALLEHAESVHTFDDIRRMVMTEIREKFGDPTSTPTKWVWIEDLAEDWVVFTVEVGADTDLFKAGYVVTGTAVTLGEETKVVRRTVYDPA